ncbi:hypothetical protein KI387_022106, partial [Taxus chinensis]
HPGFLGCQQQWEVLIMDSGDGGLTWPLGIQGDRGDWYTECFRTLTPDQVIWRPYQ